MYLRFFITDSITINRFFQIFIPAGTESTVNYILT